MSVTATAPGWLVQIGASTRLATFGDGTAMGLPFVGSAFKIEGLSAAGNLDESGARIIFDDADGAWNASHLLGELSGVAVIVWAADAGNLGVGGPTHVFSGQLDNSRAQPQRATVTAELVPAQPGLLRTPRKTIGPDTGITHTLPAGTVLRLGSAVITIEDSRS